MNKKLVKTRNARLNTLEAMACSCLCGRNCVCTNCSGGGSFQVTEKTSASNSSHKIYHEGTFTNTFVKG